MRVSSSFKSTQKRRIRGSEQLAKIRAKHYRVVESMKRPRDRAIQHDRLVTALKEMSNDLLLLEKEFEGLKKNEKILAEAISTRRDLLLRDLKKMSNMVRAKKLYDACHRVRMLSEPLGWRTFENDLPNWFPGKKSSQ